LFYSCWYILLLQALILDQHSRPPIIKLLPLNAIIWLIPLLQTIYGSKALNNLAHSTPSLSLQAGKYLCNGHTISNYTSTQSKMYNTWNLSVALGQFLAALPLLLERDLFRKLLYVLSDSLVTLQMPRISHTRIDLMYYSLQSITQRMQIVLVIGKVVPIKDDISVATMGQGKNLALLRL
jgi:hypothetical protein